MAWNKETRKSVLQFSEGVLASAVDLSIFFALWGVDFLGLANKQRLYDRSRVGHGDWIFRGTEKVNYKTIKKAFSNARQKKLITSVGKGHRTMSEITEAGKSRIEAKIPFYDSERVWNGVLYLVTYDVEEKKKKDREALRDKLQELGCGLLQKSVWITPYSPGRELQDFIEERKLKRAVIISMIGKDGSIGDDNVMDLIAKIYGLDKLNGRYKEYIDGYNENESDPFSGSFDYLAILKDDPQLPFDLLPEDWLGDKARKLFTSKMKMISKYSKE